MTKIAVNMLFTLNIRSDALRILFHEVVDYLQAARIFS